MMVKELDKIKKVSRIESAVLEFCQSFQTGIIKVYNKIMRAVIHHLHQFLRLVNDDGSVAPGKYGGKESCYLYVLLFFEKVRYGDRVFFYKGRTIVLLYLPVQKILEFFLLPHRIS